MSTPTDAHHRWLETLFERHGQALRAFATRRVGPDHADDIVSETFAVAWRRRDSVPDAALPWLYQVARNAILHHRHSLARVLSVREAVAATADVTVAGPDAAASDLVERVLAQLADMDAEVLRLTVWEELAPGEIATVLGISPGAARTRLMRARRRAQEVYLASEPETQPTPTIA